MPLTLTPRGDCPPLDLRGLAPSNCREPFPRVRVGREQVALTDLFDVDGEPDGQRLEFRGDCRRIEGLGGGLNAGELVVHGDAGPRLGAQMSGGSIRVLGNVGDEAGQGLRGGRVVIRGNAGNRLGGPAWDDARGMTGGEIHVHGDVGDEAGRQMRRGLVAIAGSAGCLAGVSMLAGTVLVAGACGAHPGVGMRRGTLIVGGDPPDLPPGFVDGCRFRPPMLPLLLRHLAGMDFPVERLQAVAVWRLIHSDLLEGGRGEILAAA